MEELARFLAAVFYAVGPLTLSQKGQKCLKTARNLPHTVYVRIKKQ